MKGGGRFMRRHAYTHILHSVCAVVMVLALALMIAPAQDEGAPVSAAVPQTLEGRVIAVDAGHGGYDGGARAPGGRWEKEYNLRVAKLLQQALEARGAQVVMTREGDYALCDKNPPIRKKRQDMERRAALVLDAGAELLVSIHMNEYRDKSQSGPQVFCRGDCPAGRQLAETLQAAMIEALAPKKERTAAAGDFYILSLGIPSALVECGFLSNAAEEALLRQEAYCGRVAEAVAKGIEDYFALDAREEAAPREAR